MTVGRKTTAIFTVQSNSKQGTCTASSEAGSKLLPLILGDTPNTPERSVMPFDTTFGRLLLIPFSCFPKHDVYLAGFIV